MNPLGFSKMEQHHIQQGYEWLLFGNNVITRNGDIPWP
jgi:hypothetical protein